MGCFNHPFVPLTRMNGASFSVGDPTAGRKGGERGSGHRNGAKPTTEESPEQRLYWASWAILPPPHSPPGGPVAENRRLGDSSPLSSIEHKLTYGRWERF